MSSGMGGNFFGEDDNTTLIRQSLVSSQHIVRLEIKELMGPKFDISGSPIESIVVGVGLFFLLTFSSASVFMRLADDAFGQMLMGMVSLGFGVFELGILNVFCFIPGFFLSRLIGTENIFDVTCLLLYSPLTFCRKLKFFFEEKKAYHNRILQLEAKNAKIQKFLNDINSPDADYVFGGVTAEVINSMIEKKE